MKHWPFIILLALTVAAGGCRRQAQPTTSGSESSPQTGVVEVEFWHTQTAKNAKALEELVGKFNQEHSGRISVRPLYQGTYDQIYRKTMAAVAAGRPPDMAVAYESMVAEYMKAGLVVPLDEYLSGPDGLESEVLADIFPAYLESNRFPEFGNQLLSFPFTKSVLVLYYNEAALQEAGLSGPPRSWDEFREAALKTTKRGPDGRVTRYGVGLWADASTIDGCILSRGGVLLSEDGKRVRFNEEPGREVFRLTADLVQQGAALRTTRQQYTADFGNGRIAMFMGSSTAREFVGSAVGDKFPWGIAVIPQKDPERPVTVQYGANTAIFKTTPEKQRAAWIFLRWLAETEQTIFWATRSSYMPIRRSAADHEEMQAHWRQDPQGLQAFEVAPFGVMEPNIRGWQDVRRHLEEAFNAVTAGQKAPDAALAEAEARSNKALAERR